MKQDMSTTMYQNDVVTDKYMSWFITESIVRSNKKLFKKPGLKEQFTIVKSYDDVFAGFLRVENFLVLVNTKLIDTFNVYALIDNKCIDGGIEEMKKNVEYYGLVKIGTLINQRGYTDDEIEQFESSRAFKLHENIKEYIRKTSIISYCGKLFHIDLGNI